MFVPLSVLEFRDRAATYFGDKVGVVDGDRELTYRTWAERTHQLANALHDLGVEPGDRVSFITYNTHHLLEAYYGVLEAGAVLNPVNIRLAPHEIAYILEHAGSRVVFFHADFAPLVEGLAAKLTMRPRFVIMEGEPGGIASDEYEALIAGGSRDPRHPQVDENAIAELFYTSGTTGLPKGVALSQRNLYLHAMNAQVALGWHEDDVILHVVPLFHVNGWGVPHFVTMIGGRHVMLRKFEPTALMEAVQRHRVTRLLGVPAIFNALVHHAARSSYDLSSLRQVVIGGSSAVACAGPGARGGPRRPGGRRLRPVGDDADRDDRPAARRPGRDGAAGAGARTPGDDRLAHPRRRDAGRGHRRARRPAGRRADRRDRRARQHGHDRLLPRPGLRRRRRSATDGSTRATWRPSTRRATS